MTNDQRIVEFRRTARFYARQAQQFQNELRESDPDEVDEEDLADLAAASAGVAALATMYLALALDVKTFGDLPELTGGIRRMG